MLSLLLLHNNYSVDLVVYLLKECQCNPNPSAMSPLSLTRDDQIIRILLDYGTSPPSYEEWSKYLPCQSESDNLSLSPVAKSFVLGNPGVGKSTLVKSLETESKGFARLVSRISKVSGVDKKTAGIIPHDLYRDDLGHITMYDLAGHKEFYAGHDALLRNSLAGSPSAVIILVADIREMEDSFASVRYWLNFIENQYDFDAGHKPHVIIVGSHADKVSTSNKKAKKISCASLCTSVHFAGFVALDCRYPESSSMTKLRSLFTKSCKALAVPPELEFQSHYCLIYILSKFRGKTATLVSTVLEMVASAPDGDEGCPKFILKFSPSNLLALFEQFNMRGNLLFMKNHRSLYDSWIVFDKSTLLSIVYGTIFAPEGFEEHRSIAKSTGIVPLTNITTEFPNLDSDLITKFLCHLEFCREINDHQVLSLLESDYQFSDDERFFFFPGLVCLDPPKQVWDPDDRFVYHSGWMLECSKQEQFLTPRFLEILILRLAFGFALAPSSPTINPTIQRQCSVWKNGISWIDRAGVRSLVEVSDQKHIILLSRCAKDNELKLLQVRSSLIHTVLTVSHEVLPNLTFDESFLHPKIVCTYPLVDTSKVSLKEIASTVAASEKYLLWNENEELDLECLLYFEPFAEMSQGVIQELFGDQHSRYDSEIDETFLCRLADNVHKHVDKFMIMLETSAIELSKANPQDSVQKMYHVLNLWKLKMGEMATYRNLRNAIESFSVFAGRNPLVCK